MSGFTLKVTTEPAAEPLTTAEAKAHLRVTDTDEDAYIASLVKAARVQFETEARIALITRTYALYMDGFPSGDCFELPRPPLIQVNSITYLDTDGNSQTLDTSIYSVDEDRQPGLVSLQYGQSWKSTRSVRRSVTVNFNAGHGSNATDVPENARHALRLLVEHWYSIREPVVVGTITAQVPMSYRSLMLACQMPRVEAPA